MSKRIFAWLLIFSMTCMQTIRAEENYPPATHNEEEDEEEISPPPAQVKYVGKAATDGMSVAQSRQIQNICIAAGVVAIAITTLVLVSKNHHNHHNHHHKK